MLADIAPSMVVSNALIACYMPQALSCNRSPGLATTQRDGGRCAYTYI